MENYKNTLNEVVVIESSPETYFVYAIRNAIRISKCAYPTAKKVIFKREDVEVRSRKWKLKAVCMKSLKRSKRIEYGTQCAATTDFKRRNLPYCGRETELVNADKIYSRKGLGMVMMCKPCNAYVGVHESGPNKGKAKGRLAGPSLRSLKIRVHAELDRLWSTPEERERMYKDLSEFLSIPEEYTHIGMFGEKTMGKIFQFCHVNKERSGSRIEWHKPGDKCPNKNNQIVSGSSACRGCPEYLHDEKDGYVWCDPDMSYGRLK